MSLVGSLEDLGLGDILQIVSLARKSGRLLLHASGSDGRIVVADGMVRAAAIKGQPAELRDLVVASGLATQEVFDEARQHAEASGADVADALAELASIPREKLEAIRREQVEQAVMDMFAWSSGEFSFEVCDAFAPEDQGLLLSTGINTQYLAMEATRQHDE